MAHRPATDRRLACPLARHLPMPRLAKLVLATSLFALFGLAAPLFGTPVLGTPLLETLTAANSAPPSEPVILSFESASLPDDVFVEGAGEASTTSDRAIDGRRSLRFEWTGDAALVIDRPVDYARRGAEGKVPVLAFHVGREPRRPDAASDAFLRFELERAGKILGSFRVPLDFRGWRAALIALDDLEGIEGLDGLEGAPRPRFDRLRIRPVRGDGGSDARTPVAGSVLLDRIVLAAETDALRRDADRFAPFVRKSGARGPFPPDLDADAATLAITPIERVPSETRRDLREIERRLEDRILGEPRVRDAATRNIGDLRSRFSELEIDPATGHGRPVVSEGHAGILRSEGVPLEQVGALALELAIAYRSRVARARSAAPESSARTGRGAEPGERTSGNRSGTPSDPNDRTGRTKPTDPLTPLDPRETPDWPGWRGATAETDDRSANGPRETPRAGDRLLDADARALRQMFEELCEHLLDQGYAAGSSLGAMRLAVDEIAPLFPAVFLMRGHLRSPELQRELADTLAWFSNAKRAARPIRPADSDLDTLGSLLGRRVLASLARPDEAERVAWLAAVSRHASASIESGETGVTGGFKPDGSAFHRGGHAPHTAREALRTAAATIRTLSGTGFALTEEAHTAVRRSLLATRLYATPDWGFGLGARDPFDDANGARGIRPLERAYLDLAAAGATVDEEIAAAYLRLWPRSPDGSRQRFGNAEFDGPPGTVVRRPPASIEPEPWPEGFFAFPIGGFAVHRHEGRSATLRGFSRYTWGTEIGPVQNRYGRFAAHGSMQVFRPGGAISSGYVEPGWDWSHPPGATVLDLPIDLLQTRATSFVRPLSDRTFVGSCSLANETGVFAIDLAEPDRPGFDPSLRARKSYFGFEDRVLCLGSDITTTNEDFDAHTTLFQHSLRQRSAPICFDAVAPLTRFPFERTENASNAHWLTDAIGNGYWIAPGSDVRVSKRTQISRDHETGEPTRGDFAAAWISHGRTPTDAGYAYVVLLGADALETEAFHLAMTAGTSRPVRVLRRDSSAHVVLDRATRTTAYALFEKLASPVATGIDSNGKPRLALGDLVATGSPCLVVLRRERDATRGTERLHLAVTDPDLALDGPTSEPKPKSIDLLLEGDWVAADRETDARAQLRRGQRRTAIRVTSRGGESIQLRLRIR